MKRVSLPLIFILARLVLFLSLPLEGLAGYGDLPHFYGWARLEGAPFLDYWMEFPPVFPFLAEGIYRLVGGREHAFYYALAALFTLAEAGCLAAFLRIAILLQKQEPGRAGWMYIALTAPLFYGWTYFDPLAVFFLLLGIWLTLRGRETPAALAFAVGGLIKWFPLLGLAALFRARVPPRLRPFLLAGGVILGVWGGLYLLSPAYTSASLRSQFAKGSWETVWALVDGNLGTGNFGAKEERFDPAAALVRRANPAVIPSWVTLIPFGLLGLWAFLRSRLAAPRSVVAFTGLALALFFLWSPGWSPQWVLYLIPLILLTLRERTAVLLAILLVLVNLLEWPLLLSRGLFMGLWLTVPLRAVLLVLLAWEFWRIIPAARLFAAEGT
jgi:hypothetical protein